MQGTLRGETPEIRCLRLLPSPEEVKAINYITKDSNVYTAYGSFLLLSVKCVWSHVNKFGFVS